MAGLAILALFAASSVLLFALVRWPKPTLGYTLLLLLVLVLVWPSFPRANEASRRSQCVINLKCIGLALHNYHNVYKCFPPAYIADDEGRPMHSWRVLLLPYLEHKDLYEQYRFDEAWDGPNNSQLADSIRWFSTLFACPSDWDGHSHNTNYVLVTGEGTAWGEGQSPQFRDFTDGISETVMVVEIKDSNIHWTEPRDLTIDQAMRGINSPAGMCISSKHPGGANALLVDGSVDWLPTVLPHEELRGLLTNQGGDKVA
jgi:prepilin-type processing-associated H-X9-DG protein